MEKCVREISPQEAFELWRNKEACFVDIRECSEFEEERIPGACLVPMKTLSAEDFKNPKQKVGVFYCRSGRRTSFVIDEIEKTGFEKVYVLKSGLIGWKKAGYPTLTKATKIPSILRQTFITLGLFILLFIFLGIEVSSKFIFGAAIIGAGLVFAGMSGT